MKNSLFATCSLLLVLVLMSGLTPLISTPSYTIAVSCDSKDTLTSSSTPWFDSSWQFRKNSSIIGSAQGPLTDYPIEFSVHRSSGLDGGGHIFCDSNCKSDFGDIRFTQSDGVSLLSHWLQEIKVEGFFLRATFWVNIPNIPQSPNTTTVWIYYGNAAVSSTSNIDATFDVACDMEEGDLSDWDSSSGPGTMTASTDYPHTGTYGLKMVPAPGTPVASRQILYLSGDTSNYSYGVWFYDTGCTALDWTTSLYLRDDSVGDNVLCCGNNGGPLGYYWYWDVGGAGYQSTGVARSTGWHFFEFRVSSSDIGFYVDGVHTYSSTTLDPSSLDTFRTSCYREYPNPSYFDDAIIRNWMSAEPTHVGEGVALPILMFLVIGVVIGCIVLAIVLVLIFRRRRASPESLYTPKGKHVCPRCQTSYSEGDIYCQHCGEILPGN